MKRTASEVLRSLENRVARLERKAGPLDKLFGLADKIEKERDLAFEHISEIEELIDAVKGDSPPASALTQVLQMTKHISKDEWLQVYKELKLGRGDYRRYKSGMEEEAIKALMREQGYRI